MPGSWEIKSARRILIGILHTDVTSIAWSFGLRNLQVPGQIMPVSGMPYDHSRNTVCKAALDNGFEWVGFLDSDVIPPNDAFVKLMSRGAPFISGVYHRRSPPATLPVMIKNGSWVTSYPANSIIEVDLVGAGCLVIHRTLLERMPPQRPEQGKPWFDWRVDMQGIAPADKPPLSEDFTLCHHVRQHGHKVLVDTSVQCKHVGFAQATFGQLQPLETTPHT